MSEIVKFENRQLPALEELYTDIDKQQYASQLATYLNKEPQKTWLKEHPFAKGVLYIPISRLEFLMTYFFADWFVEVRETKLLANSLVVQVRVHYRRSFQPEDANEWRWTDGVGAVPVQIKKEGSGATDFLSMSSNAVQIGLPAAESYAFKDAVEKLGKIFGKDLNRKDYIDYSKLLGTEENPRFPEIITEPILEDESDLPPEMRKR